MKNGKSKQGFQMVLQRADIGTRKGEFKATQGGHGRKGGPGGRKAARRGREKDKHARDRNLHGTKEGKGRWTRRHQDKTTS